MRARRFWEMAVPELMNRERTLYVRNPRRSSFGEGNLGTAGLEMVLDAVRRPTLNSAGVESPEVVHPAAQDKATPDDPKQAQ